LLNGLRESSGKPAFPDGFSFLVAETPDHCRILMLSVSNVNHVYPPCDTGRNGRLLACQWARRPANGMIRSGPGVATRPVLARAPRPATVRPTCATSSPCSVTCSFPGSNCAGPAAHGR
jgi:hypothetical protein